MLMITRPVSLAGKFGSCTPTKPWRGDRNCGPLLAGSNEAEVGPGCKLAPRIAARLPLLIPLIVGLAPGLAPVAELPW